MVRHGSPPWASELAPDQEGIIYADIDLQMIGVAKNAADPAGHYSRPRRHAPAAQPDPPATS